MLQPLDEGAEGLFILSFGLVGRMFCSLEWDSEGEDLTLMIYKGDMSLRRDDQPLHLSRETNGLLSFSLTSF